MLTVVKVDEQDFARLQVSIECFVSRVINEAFPSEGSVVDGNVLSKKFSAFMKLVEFGTVDTSHISKEIEDAYVSSVKANQDIFKHLFRLALLTKLEEKVETFNLPGDLKSRFNHWAKLQDETFENEYAILFPAAYRPGYKIPVLLMTLASLVCVSHYYVNHKLHEYSEQESAHDTSAVFWKLLSDATHTGVAATLSLSAGVMSMWNGSDFGGSDVSRKRMRLSPIRN